MTKAIIPEWIEELAIKDEDILTVEQFKERYLFRPTFSNEWHKAVLNTMREDIEKYGYTMISSHSSRTREAVYFVPREIKKGA